MVTSPLTFESSELTRHKILVHESIPAFISALEYLKRAVERPEEYFKEHRKMGFDNMRVVSWQIIDMVHGGGARVVGFPFSAAYCLVLECAYEESQGLQESRKAGREIAQIAARMRAY